MGDVASSGEAMTGLSGSDSATGPAAFIPASVDCSDFDGLADATGRSGLDAALGELTPLVFDAFARAPDVWVTFAGDFLAAMGSSRVSAVFAAFSAPGFVAATGVEDFFWLELFAEDPCDFEGDFLS